MTGGQGRQWQKNMVAGISGDGLRTLSTSTRGCKILLIALPCLRPKVFYTIPAFLLQDGYWYDKY